MNAEFLVSVVIVLTLWIFIILVAITPWFGMAIVPFMVIFTFIANRYPSLFKNIKNLCLCTCWKIEIEDVCRYINTKYRNNFGVSLLCKFVFKPVVNCFNFRNLIVYFGLYK